ncbi:glycosyltransferase [Aeromonas veronii]
MQHVSVIMPIHCANPFMDEAIDSILSQTYKSFTLYIIVNGGNESLRLNLAEKYYKDHRVNVISTEIKFIPFALNYAVNMTKSNIIIRMDSDDISYPARIECIVSKFESSNADIIFSNYNFIDETGASIRKTTSLPTDDLTIKKKLMYRCIIPHPTVAFKRDIFQKMGGYSFGQYSEDYDLWLRMMREMNVNFCCIEKPLLAYRLHQSQVTSKENLYTIFCYDFSLKIRELLLSKKMAWIMPVLILPFDFVYQKYVHILFKWFRDLKD